MLFAIAGIAVQAIEGVAPGDRPQPGSRPVRDAVAWPALESDQEGILHDLLRHTEVAKDPGEGGGELTRLLSKDDADGGLAVAGDHHDRGYGAGRSISGRISTVPRPGHVFAIRRASSRSGTSISI